MTRFASHAFGRRAFLRGAAALGAGALLPLDTRAQAAQIHELTGEVRVNGERLARGGAIRAGDAIYTAAGAAVWFTLGGDSFFLRERSELRLEPRRAREEALGALRLLTGALGAAFARGAPRKVIARTATIGIRGTGVYVESAPEETYACTCFGSTELMTPGEKMMENVLVISGNHYARRILRDPKQGMRVVRAPFERHTSAEIARLEQLAGRPDPFPK